MTTLRIGTESDPYTAGDSLLIEFTVLEPDGETPTNLTGATIRWGLSRVSRQTAILVKDNGDLSGVAITDAAAGEGTVTIDAGDIPGAGAYWHELEIVLASGESFTHFAGPFTVTPSIFPAS